MDAAALEALVDFGHVARIKGRRDFSHLIADHDVVFALWPGPAQHHGIGLRVVKGRPDLARRILDCEDVDATVAALRCRDATEAEAMRGERRADPPGSR